MKRFILAIAITLAFSASASASSRIKDIVNIEGIRENILIGYGLVVGLNGTGDRLNNAAFTQRSLISYLERLGVNTRGETLNTRNIAAVSLTATLPAFARNGSKVDVTVSAMGDSRSLQGGILLASPLMGADGEVYAVAQGAVAVNGFVIEGDSGSVVTKAVPTSGNITNGAIIEREIAFELNDLDEIDISLRNPDITTAAAVEDAINLELKGRYAQAMDPSTIRLNVPSQYKQRVASLIADIELIEVESDQIAKIVIDENSGTIVMGENVRIDTVAISQGNLVVRINETPQVSQPGAFAPENAQTVQVARSALEIDEGSGNRMTILNGGANLKELVNGLNALGVGPRDLVSILQTVKAAGALQAEISIR